MTRPPERTLAQLRESGWQRRPLREDVGRSAGAHVLIGRSGRRGHDLRRLFRDPVGQRRRQRLRSVRLHQTDRELRRQPLVVIGPNAVKTAQQFRELGLRVRLEIPGRPVDQQLFESRTFVVHSILRVHSTSQNPRSARPVATGPLRVHAVP